MDNPKNDFIEEVKKNSVGKIFSLIVLSLGIGITAVSFLMEFKDAPKTSDYISVEAVLIDAQRISSEGGTSAYRLTYEYEVDGVKETYTYTTDYEMAAGVVPRIGSRKMIEYNSNHPGQAYTGDSKIGIFEIVGVMMIFIPLTMMLAELKYHKASTICLSIGSFTLIALLITKFNFHQAGFAGILALAIPSIIGFAGIMEVITGRNGVDKKI